MTVCIPLKRLGGRGTTELRLDLGEAGTGVSPVQRHGTAAALLGYMDERARGDLDLSQETAGHLRYRRDEASGGAELEREEERDSVRAAELMGRRVKDIGDEMMEEMYRNPRTSSLIDAMVGREETGSGTQSVFSHFCEAVNIILQCDETGTGTVSSPKRPLDRTTSCVCVCVYVRVCVCVCVCGTMPCAFNIEMHLPKNFHNGVSCVLQKALGLSVTV